jgi:hypothetical protein
MAGVWTFREKLSLDAWDRVFDWDQVHPKDAATFLLSQGIEGNIKYLSTDALRCIGFTKLYETGRLEPSKCGEGPKGVPDINLLFSSIFDLKMHVKTLKDRVEILERENGSMTIFVATLSRDQPYTLEVQPCNTITAVMVKWQDLRGVQP